VSGELLTLVAPADSLTARLVRTLGQLPGEGLTDFCVIGGLAVLSRVGALYRATSDLDTVIDDGAAIAAMRARPAARPTTNGVSIGGTTIDIIEIGPIEDAGQLPDDADLRLFVVAHRFAYDSRGRVTVEVVDQQDGRTVRERAEVDMATPAALVAMKLSSYPKRHGTGIAKQGSDLQDLLALLQRHDADGALGRSLRTAPFGLAEMCADAARSLLVDDADVAAGRVRRYTSSQVDADQFRAAGQQLVDSIGGDPGPPANR
jgi:predicted nucleotidyltransferase